MFLINKTTVKTLFTLIFLVSMIAQKTWIPCIINKYWYDVSFVFWNLPEILGNCSWLTLNSPLLLYQQIITITLNLCFHYTEPSWDTPVLLERLWARCWHSPQWSEVLTIRPKYTSEVPISIHYLNLWLKID